MLHGKKVVVVLPAYRAAATLERAVLATVGRRPQTAEDIAVALGRRQSEVLKALAALAARGRARTVVHGGKT